MSNYREAFAAVTAPDRIQYRDHLGKPFVDGDSVIGTDGRGILIVPTYLADFDGLPGELSKMPGWRAILRSDRGVRTLVSRARLDDWGKCEPQTYKLCDLCDSSDGEMHCCDCGGDGFADGGSICDVCKGEGLLRCPAHKPETLTDWTAGPFGRVFGVLCNRFMLWSVLRHLTGDVAIYTNGDLDYIEFAGEEGWRFLLMPCRASDKEQEVIDL